MEVEQENEGDQQGFQFDNSNLNKRCNDVFANLDALEKKHKAFEVTRAKTDAELDKCLINQTHNQEELETTNQVFKRPTVNTGRDYKTSKKGGRHGNDRERSQPFRKPMPPPSGGRGGPRGRYGRGRNSPDYKVHPERWTSYSLEDVDVSDSSNKQAAFEFLNERKRLREGEMKEESINVDSTACSSGQFTFHKPSKSSKSSTNTTTTTTKSKDSFKSINQDYSGDRHDGSASEKVTNWRNDDYEQMDEGDSSSGSRASTSDSRRDLKSVGSRPGLRIDSDQTVPEVSQNPDTNSDIAEFSGHLKRKLDIKDLDNIEDSEMRSKEDSEEKVPGFKSRKINKKSFRSRQRRDNDDGDDDNE